MKITLMAIGKMSTRWLAEGIDQYVRRIERYVPFELKVIPDVKRGLTELRQKEVEGEAILSSLDPADHLTLLDERGKELTSRQLAEYISHKMVNLPRRWVVVIGGPYGFSDAVYRRANDKLSLSRMTLPHEMARLMATEQIYRAMTIMRGEPYHHD